MQLRRSSFVFLIATAIALVSHTGCGKVTKPKIGPTANFSATPTAGNRPLNVNFTNTSSTAGATITSVRWEFGDGATSTELNAVHQYSAAGTYTVSLTVTTPLGSDTQTKADFIVVSNGLGAPPNAAFSGTPTSGPAPLTVQFTDSSTPGDSAITARSWTFGDGGTSTALNPQHIYAAAGTYAVALSVTTAAGTDTETKPGYITVSAVPPTAQFTGTPTAGAAPLNVQFTDQSTPGSASISSRSWTFGDGGTSTATNPSHVYLYSGTYTVTLTVTSGAGSDSETKTGYIAVQATPVPPTAQFSGTPTSGHAPLAVQFTDTSSPGSAPITARSWTFGDGGTSSATNPSHSYASAGTYDVSLTVTTADGQDTNTKSGYIVVSQPVVPPTAEFSGTPTDGVAPLAVQFTDQSTPGSASISSRSWTFGDGGTSTATNPGHTYSAPGTYTVSLTVTTADGSDSQTKTGYITVRSAPVPPTAQFSGTPTAGPVPLEVHFTDQSTAGSAPITDWSWTFGDGGTSTEANPIHTYTTVGSYNVSLTVTTIDGQDTNTKNGYIRPCAAPVADFVGVPTVGVAPQVVQFNDLSSGAPNHWSWTFGDGGTSTAKDPKYTYANPGTYTVTLTSSNDCGSDTATKTGYITVADPCPNPVYTIVSATWDTRRDADADGFQERARLRWNADVTVGCTRSVLAKIYYRLVGDTTWTLKGLSPCYNITDNRPTDLGSFTVSGLPHGCYDFRIVLFECLGTTEEAVLEPAADPADLTNQCFEP